MTVIASSLRTSASFTERPADSSIHSDVPARSANTGLRFVGMLTSRHEVAERIQTQLVMKRQLRAAWLREQLAAQSHPDVSVSPGHATQFQRNGDVASSAQQMISDYGHFLSGHPIELSLCMAQRTPFQSRRQIAERILSRFYGLSGKSLDDEVEGLFLSGSGGSSETGGNAGSDMGGGTQGNSQGHDGEQSAAGENAGNPLSSDLKKFLLAEMALTSPVVSAEQKLQASRIKNQLLVSDGASLEAAQSLAIVAVERAEDQEPANSGRVSAAAMLSGAGLHDICNHLLSVHSPESVMRAIAALINSVEVLGQARAFRHEGLALSECLTRIRNLSVIMLIMEKTERVKSRLLFGLNTGKLPSDESIWRCICRLTTSRNVEPLLNILQEGDMSPLVRRTFIQELMGILRDLPVSVWVDKDSRSNMLSSMGDLSSMMVPARSVGK